MRFSVAKPQIRLVAFDLDGTLIDSKLDLALSVNATLKHVGRPMLDDEIIFSYVGKGAPTLIRKVVGEDAPEDEVLEGLEYFLSYYRDHKLDNTSLYPGVRETLRRLAGGENSSRRTLAVLTNKPERVSREILAELGVADFFRFIYGGNTFETKKPDPLGLRTLLEKTATPGSAAMIVGDSDVDIQTGANAGVWTCGVTYGFGSFEVETNPPDLTIDSLPELVAALDGAATSGSRSSRDAALRSPG
jgi:phosphoglycolate phosphatase